MPVHVGKSVMLTVGNIFPFERRMLAPTNAITMTTTSCTLMAASRVQQDTDVSYKFLCGCTDSFYFFLTNTLISIFSFHPKKNNLTSVTLFLGSATCIAQRIFEINMVVEPLMN